MLHLLVLMLAFVFTASAEARDWKPVDSGVGLILCDGEYDTRLKIVERNNHWDAKTLYEGGALSGRCGGNHTFSAWLQGPPVKEYLNSNGLPIWYNKYRITYPDGKIFESGLRGFYTPGFTTVGLSPDGTNNGVWKIDWYIVHRDTQEVRHVAGNDFTITWGTAPAATGGDWKLKDMGVGLILCDAEYDTKLKIVERNGRWDVKTLYESGALSGRCSGNQTFSAWLQGPPVKEYLNSNGLPLWFNKYRITYPDGKTFESGLRGFYTPGFTTAGLNPGGTTSGAWKIDWYIVHRDTQEVRHVGTSEFTASWGR